MLESISSRVKICSLSYSSKLSPSSLGTIWKLLRNSVSLVFQPQQSHHHPSSHLAAKLKNLEHLTALHSHKPICTMRLLLLLFQCLSAPASRLHRFHHTPLGASIRTPPPPGLTFPSCISDPDPYFKPSMAPQFLQGDQAASALANTTLHSDILSPATGSLSFLGYSLLLF